MKVKRKIIHIDDELCDGCGQCVPSCAEGAIEIVHGKARLAAERYCDGLGACLGECPNGALEVVEREAEDFDEEAVEAHLPKREDEHSAPPAPTMARCGCPSSQIRTFAPPFEKRPREGRTLQESASALSHWPVQINLVPPTAPFLKGAHLLVVSDCVPVAYPNLHGDFLPGRVVLMGCPKFDDVDAYIKKFADIFRAADAKGVTTLSMEVPCCSGLPAIVQRAMKVTGKEIPMEKVVISTRGKVIGGRGACAA